MLANRIAWVTGGARGIGEAVSCVLAREGARVAVTDLNKDDCATVMETLDQSNAHMSIRTDVSNMDSIQETLAAITSTYSQPPDILVNCAGITIDKYMLRMSEEAFDKVIDVNLKGTFLTNQAAANAMRNAGVPYGSIVNISSVVGKTGNIGQANYTASKAGVMALTKTAAKELAKFGIRVNCICPGFIKTSMTDIVPDHVKQILMVQIPLGEFGLPEDIAETAAFLASTRAKYINGAAIDVNGGLL